MSSDPITDNALLYFALAFLPVLGARFALLRWMRGANPTQPWRVWLTFQIVAGAWMVFVLAVIMPLMWGYPVFWWPWRH